MTHFLRTNVSHARFPPAQEGGRPTAARIRPPAPQPTRTMPWRFCLPLLAVVGVAATGHPLPVPGGGEALVLGSGQLNASHPMWEVQPHHWVTILTDMKVHGVMF